MATEAQDKAAVALCVIGGTCALFVLAAWAMNVTSLAALGGPYPTQPLSALGYLCLSVAMLAALRGNARLAAALLIVPLLVAATTLLQDATGTSIGADSWLFPTGVAEQQLATPGRPTIAVAVTLLFLSAGLLLAMRPGLRAGQAVAALAIAAFGTIAVAGAAMPLSGPVSDPVLRYVAAPLPALICGAVLSVALLGWRGSVWEGLFSGLGMDRTILQVVLPLLVVTPVATEWVEERVKSLGVDSSISGALETALNIAAMAALLIWVTSRASREQRARRALTRALDSAPIALTDTSGAVIHWSMGCEQLYGWTQQEARGRQKHDLLGSRAAEGTVDWDPDAEGWEEELIERRRDGSTLNVLERARRLEPRHGGEPIYVLSMTDISARTEAEAALKASEARLMLAMEASDIGILEWDAVTGRFTESTGSCPTLGVERGTMADLGSWREHVDPADRARVFETINAAIARQAPRVRFRYRFITPDGGRRMLESSAACFYDADGKLTRMISLYIDVTEREEWQSRLAQLQEEVMHVSRLSAMGEMASGLAHELNQPLTAVVNFLGTAKVLRSAGDDSKIDDLLAGASQQALRAGQIIRRLRTFVSRGTVQEELTPVGELIGDSVALALASRGRNDVDLRVEADDPDLRVFADRVQIQQVLVNLLRNAAEAMGEMPQEERRIVVSAQPEADAERLAIAVRDTGPGLSPEMLDRLFTPFVSGKEGGMGVGLSICKRIVEAHGGTLTAENNEDGGATFRFTLRTRPGGQE
ncbi:PAS domain-containing sensor histidine kinase [Sphingosinicella sp. BN140058]|uniref:PAS domain-containing sensor histidine kinase n=1 Tax=Sphingosinicella sp. BN140058 TaxID=1892855 RepID=UPI00101036D2|nr:PAS domain-containing sensor histidine kinase [Sphingosinicella sp. BN140058]QAY77279.1 PAS domain-containing sensor histidine kinase [Sphingosinicella sp. BN140058]